LFAYTYPLLSIFWTMLIFAGIVLVLFLIIYALIDNFSRHDHSGWAKAGWCILIIFLPFLGTLIYYITRSVEVD
jgi:NADH:ubiquinone oxidoreductase subunit 6 (subunit J)